MVAMLTLALSSGGSDGAALERVDGEAPEGTIEIEGVGAGPFRPEWWEAGTLNWNFDVRAPVIEPREGRWRNIYAPTVVRDKGRWRIYYGAWDGVATTNDRIYTAWTEDFLTFHDRRMVIDHGVYIHVCNCCAIRLPDGAYRMMCTVYPHREGGLNRPAGLRSPDGLIWNGGDPHPARYGDLVSIEGYENWENADINGMNAILYEDGKYRLYFGDFRNFRQVHRASSDDFRRFTYDGPVLDAPVAVNDVKRLDVAGEPWYLMAAHMNGSEMWYSLSRDGLGFGPRRTLTRSRSDADKYMVAVGWVTDGVRIHGFLYGAGAVRALNENRIFAKWLQKRVVFEAEDGRRFEQAEGFGPSALLLHVPDTETAGTLNVFAEDGRTALYAVRASIQSGQRWRLQGLGAGVSLLPATAIVCRRMRLKRRRGRPRAALAPPELIDEAG